METAGSEQVGSDYECELARLAALFAAHGGGNFSEQFSADLALEIVLNEIVERACLTTGATGAAIVLLRDGEMACRASSGSTAPELGWRLDRGSGISGECIRTRRVQRCDDAESDPRADREACHRLGVRSLMLLPLLRNAELVGIFEVFSAHASAFGERDQRTLEALADQVIKNIERVEKPLTLFPKPQTVAGSAISAMNAETNRSSADDSFEGADSREPSERRMDFVTWALGLIVLACTILLTARLVERLGWRQGIARGHHVEVTSGPVGRENDGPRNLPKTPTTLEPGSDKQEVGESDSREGSLRVYENGLEVFRITTPTKSQPAVPHTGVESGMRRASSVEKEGPMQLPPAVAQDRLIYRVEPEYPLEAREHQIQGPVVLEVHINRDGTVQELKLMNGNSALGRSAMDAVKQWRFKPHAVNGQFVEMGTTITLNFRLQR